MAWTRPTSCIFLSHVFRCNSRHLPTEDLMRRKGESCCAKRYRGLGKRDKTFYPFVLRVLRYKLLEACS